jgi:hypothetical protein
MSKGEIPKEQALRLVAYTTTLTKFLGTLTHRSVIVNSSTITYKKVQIPAALEMQVGKDPASGKS